jgi:hypothetical protein
LLSWVHSLKKQETTGHEVTWRNVKQMRSFTARGSDMKQFYLQRIGRFVPFPFASWGCERSLLFLYLHTLNASPIELTEK